MHTNRRRYPLIGNHASVVFKDKRPYFDPARVIDRRRARMGHLPAYQRMVNNGSRHSAVHVRRDYSHVYIWVAIALVWIISNTL